MLGRVTRREFVELLGAAGAGVALRGQGGGAAVVSVVDFGADPTGVADSIGAVRRAIAGLRTDGAVLEFPTGTYRFVPDGPNGMVFRGLKNVEVKGNGSQWLFDGPMRPVAVERCDGFTLRDVSIDLATLPFSQGTVIGVGDRSFTIAIDAGYQVADHEVIRAMGSYDRKTRWPMPNGVDSYNNVSDTRLVGPGKLLVMLKAPVAVEQGTTLVMRHGVYGVPGVRCEGSSRIEVSNVTFYALPGMGFFASRCDGIRLDRFQTTLKPGTNRLMSTCADGVHIANCSGTIELVDCHFQGMGDDAVNICSTYLPVAKRVGPRTLFMQNDAGTGASVGSVPKVGEVMELCSRKSQVMQGQASVVAATLVGGAEPGLRVEFDRDLPAEVAPGTLVGGAQEGTRIVIRDSSFIGLRARGVLVHKNAQITGNTFAGCSLAGILLAADTRWLEGPAVKDVSITGNSFSNCYYAHPNDRRGTITVDTAHDRSGPGSPVAVVNRNVTIAENTFLQSPGAAIYCAGVQGITIRKNHLGVTDTMDAEGQVKGAIVLRNVTDAVVEENDAASMAAIRVMDCKQAVKGAGNGNLKWLGNPSG